ncbi:MAG TPA: VCBS repeat-containing protein, partial [Pirellulales bacterium]|nr:VCBS repeat-containing protein [Pirellulales bacterium]
MRPSPRRRRTALLNRRESLAISIVALAAVVVSVAVARRQRPARPLVDETGQRVGIRPTGFRDVASASGIDFRMAFLPNEQGETFKINLYDHGCGLAIADYDGDGNDDVLFLNQLGSNALFHNRGDGTFEHATRNAGPLALGDRVCVGAAFGDYDNDGDQDLYVTSTRGGNVLFENTGGGAFRDVTVAAGVACVAHSQTPAFFDYDNDGDLDLFVTNSARWTSDEFDAAAHYYVGPVVLWKHIDGDDDLEHNVLFRNDGKGKFTDVTAEAGLGGRGWGGDLAAFDYDDDGDLDLFVTNMFGQSQLYRNDGHGHFDDVTRDTLRRTSFGAIGCKAFDFNADGQLDLFTADMHSDMWIDPKERNLVEPNKKYDLPLGPKSNAMSDTEQRNFLERFRL